MSKSIRKIGRDYNAIDACFRHAGPMKDKRAPRGGSRNDFSEFLDEYHDDFVDREVIDAMFCERRNPEKCECK